MMNNKKKYKNMKKIIIQFNKITLTAELKDTPSARKIYDALPIEAKANTWGDEIYFNIPVKSEQEPDARDEVTVGEIGYWPPGHAFCIFFGPTPASIDDKPRAASPVNVFGFIQGDATILRSVKTGDNVRIERDN